LASSTLARRLRALVDVSNAVSETVTDERKFATRVVRAAATLAGDGAVLWLRSLDDGELAWAAAAHRDARLAKLLRQVCAAGAPGEGDGLVAAVLETGAPAVLTAEDMPTHAADLHPTLVPWLRQHGASGAAVMPMFAGRSQVVGVLVTIRDRDNTPYDDDDLVFLQALADIATTTIGSARLLIAAAEAAEETRRQAELVDQVSDAIIACDAEGRIISWNAGAEQTYLYSSGEALGCDWQALLATSYLSSSGEPCVADDVFAVLRETGRWAGELRQRRADGHEVELLSSLTELPAGYQAIGGWIAVNRDVTEQRHKEQLALHDTLTGLPNRRFLLDHLRRALLQCGNSGMCLAVLFLDLDGFKLINDTLGHEGGDEVLRVTAQRLAGAVRRHDVVARLGGDEFVVVAADLIGVDGAQLVADRLLDAAREPIKVDERMVRAVPSIGIAMVEGALAAIQDPDQLIWAADAAMYRAKRTGSGLAFAPLPVPEDPEDPEDPKDPEDPTVPAEPADPSPVDVQPSR
jgi:diguanylate cyclase (GGDEF)-like protein/PAS domain S-box-containing protein